MDIVKLNELKEESLRLFWLGKIMSGTKDKVIEIGVNTLTNEDLHLMLEEYKSKFELFIEESFEIAVINDTQDNPVCNKKDSSA
tara:strand:- start:18 stop:269 length:252 start_codon:yes stop_codon:yes gene_type:complete